MASISLRNVTKIFGRHVTAVSDLSLEIAHGELVVLVGPSGCGKTTTLSLIAGLEHPTSGEIRIADRVVNSLSPRQRDIAMVFQDGALYPHMSVYDNLAFALRMRKLPAPQVQQRVQAAAAMLRIADLTRRKPSALSGGQRQRVALGRAVVREPAAFLFDEPLTGLDAALRLAMRSEIKSLHQRLGVTTVYVTHDQSEAMALGDRIGVLRNGRLQQVGRPGDIYDRPANRFVAGFFGMPTMNFLTGVVRWHDGAPVVDLPGQTLHMSSRLRGCLGERSDKTIVAGIRPHDLSLEPSADHVFDVLRGRATLVEPLGSQTNVHLCLVGDEPCVVVAPPRTSVLVGDEVRVYVNPDEIHWFESDEVGRSIGCSGPGQ